MDHSQPNYQNQQPDQIEATGISPEKVDKTMYTWQGIKKNKI